MALEDASPDFDLVAASLRADSGDVHTFLETVAVKLEEALPGLTEVRRGRQGLRGPKLVRDIIVTTRSARLELHRQGAGVEALRARVSGGITIKTEPVDMNTWIVDLAQVLETEAQQNLQTRQALARLLDT